MTNMTILIMVHPVIGHAYSKLNNNLLLLCNKFENRLMNFLQKYKRTLSEMVTNKSLKLVRKLLTILAR